MLAVACDKCGHSGRYPVAKLAEQIGWDGKLADWPSLALTPRSCSVLILPMDAAYKIVKVHGATDEVLARIENFEICKAWLLGSLLSTLALLCTQQRWPRV